MMNPESSVIYFSMDAPTMANLGAPQDPFTTDEFPGRRAGAPRDRWNKYYIGFVLAGVGFLLPYNSFIVAVDYFQQQFPGTTIVFDISLVYIISALASVMANNLVVERYSFNKRILFGYIVSFSTLAYVAIFQVGVQIFPVGSSTGRLTVLMAVALLALGCTVQQSSFYGYTSMMPARYTQAVMVGESAAGLIVSVNRIITKDLISDMQSNTMYFFTLSICIVAICLITHRAVEASHFVQYHLAKCRKAKNSFLLESHSDKHQSIVKTAAPPMESSTESHASEDLLPEFGSSCQTKASRCNRAWYFMRSSLISRAEIAKQIWPHMLAIGLAYFVTLCLFPGIESEISSCYLGSWMPVLMMAVFNLADLIGKALASIPYQWSSAELVLISLSRILLVPLLIMCATPRTSPFISSEMAAFLLSAILGVTNGIFGSVPMILAPGKIEKTHRELAGNIMTLSYSFGLAAGSIFAYWLDSMLGAPTNNPCTGMSINRTNIQN